MTGGSATEKCTPPYQGVSNQTPLRAQRASRDVRTEWGLRGLLVKHARVSVWTGYSALTPATSQRPLTFCMIISTRAWVILGVAALLLVDCWLT